MAATTFKDHLIESVSCPSIRREACFYCVLILASAIGIIGCSKTATSTSESDWKRKVDGSPEFEKLQKNMASLFEVGATPATPEELKSSVEEFLTAFPSEGSVTFLARQAVDAEYAGNPAQAASVVESLKPRLGWIQDSARRSNTSSQFELFAKRMSLLGKPINLTGLATISGSPLDWSAYKGKVVLVDFWTTECAPCLGEIPNMKAVYEKYNHDGFDIVGVNMDENPEAVASFLQERKLPWTTVRSSDPAHVAYDSPLAQQMGITGIPFMFLVDRHGNVAALHTREKVLEKKVVELLGND